MPSCRFKKPLIIIATVLLTVLTVLLSTGSAWAYRDPANPVFDVNPPPAEIKAKLYNAAVSHGIPPEILYGIAYQESTWRQFDSDGGPLISDDGGIGIMQITDYGGYDTSRLAYDIDYNINAGAEILLNKFAQTPHIGDDSKNTYENWFFAVWAYNGWVPGNDYPYKVFNWVVTGPQGLWPGVPVNSVQGDWLDDRLGQTIPTPQPAHYWNPPAPSAPAAIPGQQAAPPPAPPHPADQARITANGQQDYFIERGKKRLIPDLATLKGLNQLYGGDVTWVPASTLDDYADGRAVPSVTWPDNHDGILLRGASNGTVYVMKHGRRRLLFNLDQTDPDDGDFYYPSDIRVLPDPEVISLPLDAPTYEEGQLLAGPPPGPVYVIEDGKKRRIPDPETFSRSGYSWANVIILPQVLINMIPKGEYIPEVQLSKSGPDILASAGSTLAAPSGIGEQMLSRFSWAVKDWRTNSIPAG